MVGCIGFSPSEKGLHLLSACSWKINHGSGLRIQESKRSLNFSILGIGDQDTVKLDAAIIALTKLNYDIHIKQAQLGRLTSVRFKSAGNFHVDGFSFFFLS